MKKRITSLGVHQTSKTMAVLYALFGAIFLVIGVIAAIAFGQRQILIPAILAPVLYGVIGYIAMAIFCLIYNVVAKISGGIEVDLSE